MPEVAARAHLRWIVPVLDEAWADAGVGWADVDAIAVTYGPGLAGSLLVGINFAKALAWVHDRPLVGVNHLEGHVYAGWLLDPGATPSAPEPVFPLVALVVSGGHTFLVEMRDHLTYRLLGHDRRRRRRRGVRQGRPPARARLPGRAGHPAGGRGARPRRDRVFPRAWLGDSYDFSFCGLKTAARRIVDRGAGRRGPAPDDPGRAAARRGRRGARLGVPGRRRRRPRDQDDPGRAGRPGARSIVLGGGVAANARPARPASRGEAEALGIPLVVPRPGLCTDNGAMIGAAGRPPVRGRRAGRARPRRPAVAAAGRPMSAARPARPTAARPGRRPAPRSARPACAPATRLSQNFLADVDVLEAILAEAGPGPGRRVLEIGPGLGILTGGLLDGRRRGHRGRARPRAGGVPARCRFGGPALDGRGSSGSSRATRSTRTS